MSVMDHERAPRAVLDTSALEEWLDILEDLTRLHGSRALQFLPAPYGDLPTVASFNPFTVFAEEGVVRSMRSNDLALQDTLNYIETLMLCAGELGMLDMPAGTQLWARPSGGTDDRWVEWRLGNDLYGGLQLTTEPQDLKLKVFVWDTPEALGPIVNLSEADMDRLISGGRDTVIRVLTSAVWAANAMLSDLLSAAVGVVANLSANEAVLNALAFDTEPAVRALLLDNPATPDEVRVIAALDSPPRR